MLLSTNNRDACRIRLVVHSDRKLAERVYRDRQRIRGATGAEISLGQTIAALLERAASDRAPLTEGTFAK